jgi:hypothetical protein
MHLVGARHYPLPAPEEPNVSSKAGITPPSSSGMSHHGGLTAKQVFQDSESSAPRSIPLLLDTLSVLGRFRHPAQSHYTLHERLRPHKEN